MILKGEGFIHFLSSIMQNLTKKILLCIIVPWTDENPIVCIVLNTTSFDALATSTGRRYHFTTYDDAGSAIWLSLISV